MSDGIYDTEVRVILSWKIDIFPDNIVDFFDVEFDEFVGNLRKIDSGEMKEIDVSKTNLYLHDEWMEFNKIILSWDVTSKIDSNPFSLANMPKIENVIRVDYEKTKFTFFFYRNGMGILRGEWLLKLPNDYDYNLLEYFDTRIGDYLELSIEEGKFDNKISSGINSIIKNLKQALSSKVKTQEENTFYKVIDWDDIYIIRDKNIEPSEFLGKYKILHGLEKSDWKNLLTINGEYAHLVIGYDGSILFLIDDSFDEYKIYNIVQLMEIAGSYIQAIFSLNKKLRKWIGKKEHLFPNSTTEIDAIIKDARKCVHYLNILASDSNPEFIAADKENNNILSACYDNWNYKPTLEDAQKKSSIISNTTSDLYSEIMTKKSDVLNKIVLVFTIITFSATIATLIEVIDFKNNIFPLYYRITIIFVGTVISIIFMGIYALLKIEKLMEHSSP